MSRKVLWLQLLIGWLPVWALFATLIATAHRESILTAGLVALRMIIAAALLGLVVQRLTEKYPWSNPVRLRFVAVHFGGAIVYSSLWLLLNSAIESVVRGTAVIIVGYGVVAFMMLGIWLYVMIAGVSYTASATERVALAEASAARAQLTALRAQLNPHFLFNSLHTVVQLIPREPRRAAQAAEELAGLLRVTIEEDRDIVSVEEELAFVQRYLEVERIRFGDRLRVSVDLSDDARASSIPSFAVQTLVENAVRHGAAPRVDPTDVSITGRVSDGMLNLQVRDTGAGATTGDVERNGGTGLKRLRDRLTVLYGNAARLDIMPGDSGFNAVLAIPQITGD